MRHFRYSTLACLVLVSHLSCRRDPERADATSGPTSGETATTSPASTSRPAGVAASIDDNATASKPLSETEKIEALIDALGNLEGASFIRNRKGHTVDEAIAHMRMKWKWKASEIKTAEDFIRVAATKSSTSGERYRIILAGGEEIASADWFRTQLQRIEAGH